MRKKYYNKYIKLSPTDYKQMEINHRLGLCKFRICDIYKRKHKLHPYGKKFYTGWGGLDFFSAYRIEEIFPIINKGGYRKNIKNQLKSKLLDEDLYINMKKFK